jgi:hypothetical protein
MGQSISASDVTPLNDSLPIDHEHRGATLHTIEAGDFGASGANDRDCYCLILKGESVPNIAAGHTKQPRARESRQPRDHPIVRRNVLGVRRIPMRRMEGEHHG